MFRGRVPDVAVLASVMERGWNVCSQGNQRHYDTFQSMLATKLKALKHLVPKYGQLLRSVHKPHTL